MDKNYIINQLVSNREVIKNLLEGQTIEEYLWRPSPGKWCLLEIVCHLHDEEREDFRTRLRSVLEDSSRAFPPIDPVGWVESRKYIERDYNEMVQKWLEEREQSVSWLKSLTEPSWENAYQHPKFGPMSGAYFISNWLAHDYLHIRQINRLKYAFLNQGTNESLNYAGTW